MILFLRLACLSLVTVAGFGQNPGIVTFGVVGVFVTAALSSYLIERRSRRARAYRARQAVRFDLEFTRRESAVSRPRH